MGVALMPEDNDIFTKIDPDFNYDTFMQYMARWESDCNYQARNGNYLGIAQLGYGALKTIGYGPLIKQHGGFKKFKKYFLENPELQDEACKKWFEHLAKTIDERGYADYIGKPFYRDGQCICPDMNLYSMLMVAHLGGPGALTGKASTKGLHGFLHYGANPNDGSTSLVEYAVYGQIMAMGDIPPDAAIRYTRAMYRAGKDGNENAYNFEALTTPEKIEPVKIAYMCSPAGNNEVALKPALQITELLATIDERDKKTLGEVINNIFNTIKDNQQERKDRRTDKEVTENIETEVEAGYPNFQIPKKAGKIFK